MLGSETMADDEKKPLRRVHSDDFKARAVTMVVEGKRSYASVAEALDVSHTLVRGWVKLAEGRERKSHHKKPEDQLAEMLHPKAIEKFHKALPALQAKQVADLGIQAEDIEPIRQVLTLAKHAGMSTGQVVQRMFESVMMEALKR